MLRCMSESIATAPRKRSRKPWNAGRPRLYKKPVVLAKRDQRTREARLVRETRIELT